MIELYGCGSPNVLKVLFMLGEVELPYTLRVVNVAACEQYQPEFLALNPNAKVPVLVDPDGPDGTPLTLSESGAILIYLAEKTGKLLPGDLAARSVALQWLMWQMASVGPMFGQALHFTYLVPPGNDYGRLRYRTEVNRLYDVMNTRLENVPWLAGDAFTIADVAAFPWIGKYVKTLDIDIEARPNVQRWIQAVEARPGYQRIEQQGKELFKRGQVLQKQATPEQLDRFFGRTWAADG